MPDPAAGNWGLTSLTGFLDGSILDVFASNPAEEASGVGEKGQGGAGGSSGAATGSIQVQPTSRQQGFSHQHLCGASSKPGRTVSGASLSSDLPELGRLTRTMTPNTSVPTSDEEPACRGSSSSSSGSQVAPEKGGGDRPPGVVGKRAVSVSAKAKCTAGPPTAAATTAVAQVHKPAKATGRQTTAVAAGTAAAGGGRGGAATTPAATAGRWARTGGIPSSSASTLVPGMSPAITPAINKAGSSEDSSSSTDDNNDKSPTATKSSSSSSTTRRNNVPAPLDLSAIATPAPPLNRNGGKFGSSASKLVVLQGAALESLKRLGRPGSSVSDHSKSAGSAGGADMTVPLGAAIPMAVPLGAVVRPPGSNNLLSEKKQRQPRSSVISKDFHTTGSYVDKASLGGGGGVAAWARSESSVSGVSSRGRGGPTAGIGRSAIGKAVPEDDGSSSDDDPPPPSPMLTAHLRGPQDGRDQPSKKPQPGGRGRAFKGRGVRPQTWNEEDGEAAATSPHRATGAGAAVNGQRKGGEAQQQQQQQHKQLQQQNQMRLVARNPQDVSENHDTFLSGQVSPGALSMVSCSTALSRGAPDDAGSNDSDKHLDTLAGIARRGSGGGATPASTAELAPGLGRGAFEDISMSPSIPLRGNDLAGVSKAMPSKAFPAAPVGEVQSLGRQKASLASNAGSSSSGSLTGRSRAAAAGGRPHVLAAQGLRSFTLDKSFSGSPRADVPSLTVAHAPGKVYQPIVVGPSSGGGGSHHSKRSSGAVARGTPAAHSTGSQHGRYGGDGGATAPFRLPSSMRLTSFGSRASSIMSPQQGSQAGWDHQEQGQGKGKQQKDLGEDTSELARRPTMIDMLSTFGGSNSYGHSQAENPPASAANTGVSRSNVGGGGEDSGDVGGGGRDKDHWRRSASGTRHSSSKRGDRISQRRSRSSGSQVGGSRRFSSNSIVAESDVRSSRDRRRSASRSISAGSLLAAEERANSGRPEESRKDATHDPVDVSKWTADNKELSLSPAGSQSLRAGTGPASETGSRSSRRKALTPSGLSSASSKRRSARGGGGGKGGDDSGHAAGTGKQHRRRSSGVAGAMANTSIFTEATAAGSTSLGGGDPRNSQRSRSRSPRAKDWDGSSGGDQSSSDAGSSSHRRRSREAAVDGAKAAAGDVEAPVPSGAEAAREDPSRVGIVPRTLPVSVSPGSEGQRRWSRSSKKPSIVPSNSRSRANSRSSANPRSSLGARKTATIKKRKVQRFLAIASLFRKNGSYSSSSDDGGDPFDDEQTAVATAVGVNSTGGDNAGFTHRPFARSESRELTNAGRRSHGGGFVGWLWRTVTRQRGRMAGSGGGGGSGVSTMSGARNSRKGGLAAAAAAAATASNNSQQQQQQQQQQRRRPKSMSARNGNNNNGQGQNQSSSSGGCGPSLSVHGGCISQFYDTLAADEDDALGTGGHAKPKTPSAEEVAEARARVQQLLRTSQVHNKHSSMRSSSFLAEFASGGGAVAPSSTVATSGAGVGMR